MNLLKFEEKNSSIMIKFQKKCIIILRCIIYLNIFIALMNGYFIYYHPSNWFNSICTGAIICNILWTIGQLGMIKDDLQIEREYLLYIKENKEMITN